MTKKDLIKTLAERAGLTLVAAEAVLLELNHVICTELDKNGEIVLPGIGKFYKHHRAARTARNPANGEPIKVPAKTTAKFKPAKALVDIL